MYGWAGRILYVDLTKGRVRKKETPKGLREAFIGGRGINAKLLWDLTKPGVNPLSPENVLIFGAGTLTGTPVPMTGRLTVTTKSPQTNLYLKSVSGGHFAGELKFAGYDHIVVYGRAEKPLYLWIEDDHAELRSADHLWGMDVKETNRTIKSDHKDREIKTVCIGPAGENLVKYASVMNTVYNVSARGGVGAVMGSKRLKAIAVKGSGTVEVKNPERLMEVSMKIVERLSAFSPDWCTTDLVDFINRARLLPSLNFRSGFLEDGHKIGYRHLKEAGYVKGKWGCFSCIVGCHLHSVIKEGPYTRHTVGPEYETAFALGSNTGVTDPEALIRANELCALYGLDTISTGSAISWAMECYERGVISKSDTGGLELKFGNAEAMLEAIRMIAFRRGWLGDLLAEGVKRASERLGRGSWKWAMCNSKGMEHAGLDLRTWKTRVLSYSVNPRGPDHLFHQVASSFDWLERILEVEEVKPPLTPEEHAKVVAWYGDRFAVTDALGICKFSGGAMHTNEKVMAELYTLATGVETTPEDILAAGRRIYVLERCYNVREGFDRRLDDIAWRFLNEPTDWPEPPTPPPRRNRPIEVGERSVWRYKRGLVVTEAEMKELQDAFYRLQGWDLETGWPRRETLLKLGLADVADELGRLGRLP